MAVLQFGVVLLMKDIEYDRPKFEVLGFTYQRKGW